MARPSAYSLAKLVEEPFGPYWENEVLSEALHNTTVKNPVVLRCLTLESGGVITGLSECEASMPEKNKERFEKHPPRLMGDLQIRHLWWLKPEIVREIEAELRERDVQARRSLSNPHPQPSHLTLKALYSPTPGFRTGQYKITVTIQAQMGGTASWLLSNDVPDGLRVSSRARNYRVDSMMINTYELSRLYLSRWGLYVCLQRLVELERSAGTLIPPEERTPDWYIDSYFKHYAYHSSGRQYRAVHTESDSDIEPGTNGRMKDRREHPLRHVSRAEMESYLAQHAVWLIQETRLMRRTAKRLFDPNRWQEEWLPDVRHTRAQAAEAGRRWGLWEGSEVPLEDIEGFALPSAPSKKKRRTTKTGAMAQAHSNAHDDRDLYDDDAMYVDGKFPDPTSLREYDPDFSPPSSDNEAPPTSDEEEDVNTMPVTCPDPEIIALIPASFRHRPLPCASLKWKCTECDYVIDLLNLTLYDMNNPKISYSVMERLLLKEWNMFTDEDRWAYDAFLHMVDKHHQAHLEEWGIVFRRTPGGWMADWKDGRHPQRSRLRQVKVDDRRQTPIVKTEEL
ncbi:hypothetical protein K466DRAFT_108993 [Polyporus arcularius HHB13444]|uniref:Uncharacterized protein n=1 Tax=Polyporus arcularius HHB13444 TaxID=1314778 RepID=A0A5C3PXE3_9APHY|nr:hypothetical protein K466DRAFT_108993 [Polyporus arcularius HHB13444]